MKRYVDADLAKAQFTGNFQDSYSPSEAKAMIDEVPTADVAPVIHAHWVYLGLGVYKCSDCLGENKDNTAFCPNCGAKMDEEQKKCSG